MRTYHTLKGAAENHNVTLVTCVQIEDELRDESLAHLRDFCHNVFAFRIPTDMSKSTLAKALVLNLFSPLPFVAQKYDIQTMRRKIKTIMATQHIDLVHVDMLPLTVYINEFVRLPRVLVNHNVESLRLYRWFKTERNLLKKVYLGSQWLKLRSFERSAMSRFDSAIVVSETDKRLLKAMGIRTRLFVVPNGTDTTFFKPAPDKAVENLVLWVGHMDVHTNKDAVIYFWREICPILRRKQPEMRVSFIGTSPPKEIMRAASTDSSINVTGFVEDIRPHLTKAAVVVVPIRIGSGTRLKILDAMAMGKAIVSTTIGCEGLNVTDRQNILIADHPKSFADNTIELLKNTDMRRNIENEARKLAKTYDWQIIRKEQESVYTLTMGEQK